MSGSTTTAPSWKTTHTEFVAVILADHYSTSSELSSRLDPLVPASVQQSQHATSNSQEHASPPQSGLLWWLQVAGISVLGRLLKTSATLCGFTQIVLVIEADDRVTRPALLLPTRAANKASMLLLQVVSGSCNDLTQPLVLSQAKDSDCLLPKPALFEKLP